MCAGGKESGVRTKRGIVTILVLAAFAATACGGASSSAWEDFDRSYPSVGARDGYISASGFSLGVRTFAGDIDGIIDGDGVVSFYCFETGGISDTAIVESAVLRVYQEEREGTPYTWLGSVVVDHVQIGDGIDVNDYDGGTITPNIGTLSTTAANEWKTVDVTAAVQNDVSANRQYSEFRVRFTTDSNTNEDNDMIIANDGEDSYGSGRIPQLVVSYRAPRL